MNKRLRDNITSEYFGAAEQAEVEECKTAHRGIRRKLRRRAVLAHHTDRLRGRKPVLRGIAAIAQDARTRQAVSADEPFVRKSRRRHDCMR